MTLVNMARLFRAIVKQPDRIVFFSVYFSFHTFENNRNIFKFNFTGFSTKLLLCVLTFLSSAMMLWLFFRNHLKNDVKKRKFLVNLAVLLAVARNCVCRSVHGLLWNKQVWIKQLAVEGAKAMRPYWLTHRLVLTDASLIDSLLVSFETNVTKKLYLGNKLCFKRKNWKNINFFLGIV